jgi:hypothetical protein
MGETVFLKVLVNNGELRFENGELVTENNN